MMEEGIDYWSLLKESPVKSKKCLYIEVGLLAGRWLPAWQPEDPPPQSKLFEVRINQPQPCKSFHHRSVYDLLMSASIALGLVEWFFFLSFLSLCVFLEADSNSANGPTVLKSTPAQPPWEIIMADPPNDSGTPQSPRPPPPTSQGQAHKVYQNRATSALARLTQPFFTGSRSPSPSDVSNRLPEDDHHVRLTRSKSL